MIRTSMLGRLCVTIALFFAFRVLFFALSLPYQAALAMGAVILCEVSWWLFKKRRAGRFKEKAVSLQAQLHDLKQKEFALRYEEAKNNGALDRFEKAEEI